jgi:hypothetical protein
MATLPIRHLPGCYVIAPDRCGLDASAMEVGEAASRGRPDAGDGADDRLSIDARDRRPARTEGRPEGDDAS